MKRKFVYTLLFFILVVINVKVFAQQTPVFSQYMFNKFLINPAIAGSEGYTAFNLTVREQWLGLKDAPGVYEISGQTRVSPKSWLGRFNPLRTRTSRPSRISRVGVGGYIFKDHRGLLDQTGIEMTYAYHIPLDEAQLSFGLSLTVIQFAVNKSRLNLFETDDDLINSSNLKSISPDFNFGAYYTSKEWYAGFSAIQLIQNAIKFNNLASTSLSQRRHYFLMGGYRFAIDRDYSIEPSSFIKSSEKLVSQMDLGARVYYRNEYWGGLAFRTAGWLVVNAGVRYDRFYFTYACDFNFSKVASNTFGSHEFMMAYKFGMNVRQYKWLERY